MSRNERLSTDKEIARNFVDSRDPRSGSGPVLRKINHTLYIDDSEAHVEICGNTGMGKTQCVTLPEVKLMAEKGESGIIIDSKGELYKTAGGYFADYKQFFCVDFSNPRESLTQWNPLKMPHQLFRSDNPADQDTANILISDLWSCVYPRVFFNGDAFWTDAASNYAKGLTYGLFESVAENEINLDSVHTMMEQSEKRMGSATLLKAFYESLPPGSLAKRNLATYVTAPNETRGSIHSVAAAGMEFFSRSRGLMEMLREDTLDILNIDVKRRFVLFIILPEETEAYDRLAGLLVSQFTGYLLRSARKFENNKLPIRVNVILEELGSVGKSLPDLHKYIAQGRSKNIRLYLILQSESQLDDVFGKSKADTIRSCIGITIGFSSNNWNMIDEWSLKCGEEWVIKERNLVKDRLIQTSKLAAMPKGRAIVMVNNRFKFVSQLPFFYEMYRPPVWNPPRFNGSIENEGKTFDFEAKVMAIKKEQMKALLSKIAEESTAAERSSSFSMRERPVRVFPGGMNERIAGNDAKIAELETEAAKDRARSTDRQYHVIVTCIQGSKLKIARSIAAATGDSFTAAMKKLEHLPADVPVSTEEKALKLAEEVTAAGGEAAVVPA